MLWKRSLDMFLHKQEKKISYQKRGLHVDANKNLYFNQHNKPQALAPANSFLCHLREFSGCLYEPRM